MLFSFLFFRLGSKRSLISIQIRFRVSFLNYLSFFFQWSGRGEKEEVGRSLKSRQFQFPVAVPDPRNADGPSFERIWGRPNVDVVCFFFAFFLSIFSSVATIFFFYFSFPLLPYFLSPFLSIFCSFLFISL